MKGCFLLNHYRLKLKPVFRSCSWRQINSGGFGEDLDPGRQTNTKSWPTKNKLYYKLNKKLKKKLHVSRINAERLYVLGLMRKWGAAGAGESGRGLNDQVQTKATEFRPLLSWSQNFRSFFEASLPVFTEVRTEIKDKRLDVQEVELSALSPSSVRQNTLILFGSRGPLHPSPRQRSFPASEQKAGRKWSKGKTCFSRK